MFCNRQLLKNIINKKNSYQFLCKKESFILSKYKQRNLSNSTGSTTSRSSSSSPTGKSFRTFPGKTIKPVQASSIVHPDGLTRYPSLTSINGVLRSMDWLGIVHECIWLLLFGY